MPRRLWSSGSPTRLSRCIRPRPDRPCPAGGRPLGDPDQPLPGRRRGEPKSYLSVKLDPEGPARPARASPDVRDLGLQPLGSRAFYLRFGKVARGGLRWSGRGEGGIEPVQPGQRHRASSAGCSVVLRFDLQRAFHLEAHRHHVQSARPLDRLGVRYRPACCRQRPGPPDRRGWRRSPKRSSLCSSSSFFRSAGEPG